MLSNRLFSDTFCIRLMYILFSWNIIIPEIKTFYQDLNNIQSLSMVLSITVCTAMHFQHFGYYQSYNISHTVKTEIIGVYCICRTTAQNFN